MSLRWFNPFKPAWTSLTERTKPTPSQEDSFSWVFLKFRAWDGYWISLDYYTIHRRRVESKHEFRIAQCFQTWLNKWQDSHGVLCLLHLQLPPPDVAFGLYLTYIHVYEISDHLYIKLPTECWLWLSSNLWLGTKVIFPRWCNWMAMVNVRSMILFEPAGPEQPKEPRYQATYHTYLASGRWLSYRPRVERVVGLNT